MKASSLRKILLTHPSKYITKESPVTTLRDNSSASLWSTPPFLTPHQIMLQDGMTDQSHLCQPGLFIARKLPQIAKQQTNIIYYHMGQLSTASACSHFFLHFLPLPTQSTFIFFFFSLEEPLFFIFILEPLVFRCSKCCNIFSPQIKCEVLTSSKKIKHTRRILLIVPSWHQKATTLRTAEDAMFVCCGSLWVIVCSSYLFRFLEVWETAKNEPQKNEVPHRWIQYPLQFITSIFWGVHFSQIVIFGTSSTFCSFCQQDFLSDNSKWLNFPIKFKKNWK